jgi:putative acetyltransferase
LAPPKPVSAAPPNAVTVVPVTTDADPVRDPTLPITIRPERGDDPAEADAITALVTAAFGSDFEGGLPAAIRASANYIPESALVAVHDGRVVGHVMISHVDLRGAAGVVRRVATLSPLAVAPDVQGRGVGRALVRAVVAVAEARGEALVVLEGSPRYYGPLGFEHAIPHGIAINLPDWAPPEAAQVMRFGAADPALTGTIEYPPYFTEA